MNWSLQSTVIAPCIHDAPGVFKVAKSKKQQKEIHSNKEAGIKPRRRRGRPEKPLKIDDTPRNVARTFFGIKSPKYVRPE